MKKKFAENLNKYFANIGPNIPSKVPNEQGGFEKYLANCSTSMNDATLTDEEVRNAFYSSKLTKVQATIIYLLMQLITFLTL